MSGRWFRLYDDIINDPKVLKLPEAMRWQWVAMLAIASKHGGLIPPIEDVALLLRKSKQQAAVILAALVSAGLVDRAETGFSPHNWDGRQYKSDVSTERVKRFRKRGRNVSETPPETEDRNREQKDSAADAAGAVAPIDHRKRLFDEGLPKLAGMTGKGPDACRSFLGKCLKEAGDDAVVVLGLIEDAERNKVADPSAWIAACLKSRTSQGAANGRRTVHDAARDLAERVRALDEPAPGLRDAAGGSPVRLLSQG